MVTYGFEANSKNVKLILDGNSGGDENPILSGFSLEIERNALHNLTLSGGNINLTDNVAISNSISINNTDAGSVISGVISGTGSLTKSGTGTLTLSGSNSYTGATNISAGTLNISSTGRLYNTGSWSTGNNVITVSDDATLKLYKFSGSDGSLSYLLYYASYLVIDGGTLEFTGTNGVMGDAASNGTANKRGFTITSNGGTLVNNTGYTWSIWQDTDTLEYNPVINGDIAFSGSGDFSYNTVLSGAISLTKSGTGTLTLSGANDYTGSTTISAGTIAVSSSANLGATPGSADADNIIFNGGTLNTTADFTLGTNKGITLTGNGTINTNTGTTLTYAGVITGSGNLTKSGTGTLTLSGTNDYTGSTTISAGTIAVSSSANLGATPGSADADNIIFNGGTLNTTADFTLGANKGITLTGNGTINTNTGTTLTYAGIITGSGNLTKSGTGTLTLSGTNTYTGSTTISAGTIAVSSSANLGATPGSADADNIIFNGGTLNTTADFTLGANKGITLTGNGTINTNTGTTLTYAGIITGSGNLTKSGAGTLTLGGSNDYTGATTINSGVLSITHNNALGTTAGTTTVASGAALHLSNDVTVAEAITMSGSGISNNGAIRNVSDSNTLSGLITLAADSEIQIDSGSTLAMNVASGNAITGTYNLTVESVGTSSIADPIATSTGTLTKTGAGTLTLSGDNTYTGSTSINAGTLTLQNDVPSLTSSSYTGAGTLIIQPNGTSFTNAYAVPVSKISTSLGSLTVGKSGNTANITITGDLEVTNNLTIYGPVSLAVDDVSINSTSGNILFGNVINSDSTRSRSLSLVASSGDITLGGSVGSTYKLESLSLTSNNIYLPNANISMIAHEDIVVNGVLTHPGASEITLTLTAGDDIYLNKAITATNNLLNLLITSGNLGNTELDRSFGVVVFEGDITTNGGDITVVSANIYFQATSNQTIESSGGDITLKGHTISSSVKNTSVWLGVLNSGSPGSLTINTGNGNLTITGTVDSASIIQRQTAIAYALTGWTGVDLSSDIDNTGDATAAYVISLINSNDGDVTALSRSVSFDDSAKQITFDVYMFDTWDADVARWSDYSSGTNNPITAGDFLQLSINGSAVYTQLIRFNYDDQGDDIAAITGNKISTDLYETSRAYFASGYSGNMYATSAQSISVTGISGISYYQKYSAQINTTSLSGSQTIQLVDNLDSIAADESWGLKNFLVRDVATSYSGNTTLIINSGSGDVTFSDNIGSSKAMSDITISAGALTAAAVKLQGLFGVTNTDSSQVSGVIANGNSAASLTKSGTGTLTLSGTNTYTGSTTISAGTIAVSSSANLGATPGSADADNIIFNGGTLNTTADFTLGANKGITLTGNGTINTNTGTTLTYAGVITGSGNLTKSGTGTLTLSGTNTYTGSTTISAGTIAVSSSANLGATPGSADADNIIFNGGTLNTTADFTLGANKGITLTGNGTINTNTGTTLTYAGVITGSGNLTKSGTGTLTLSGANDYTGSTTISAGTIAVSSSANLGATPGSADADNIIFNGGTLNTTADFTLGANKGITLTGNGTINTNTGTTLTYAGVITGSGNLTKSGTGTLTLSGTNDYTGSTTISAGTIAVSSSANLGATPGSADADNIIFNGGTLNTTADFTLGANKGITLTGNGTINTNTGTTLTYAGVITGSGNLTKSGTGTLTLSGTNTYTGSTTISAGTIAVSADTGLGTAPGAAVSNQLTLNGGTLAATETFTLNANRGITLGSSHGNINVANTKTLTLTGVTTGSNNLTKSGSGSLTLAGRNTYSGTTIISEGILIAGIETAGSIGSITSGPFGTGNLVVNSNAAIDLAGYRIYNNISLFGTGYNDSGALYNSNASEAVSFGDITLSADTLIKNNGNLVLNGSISGAYGLTVTNIGKVTFGSAVGSSSTKLTSLTIANDADLYGSIWTSGAQSYGADIGIANNIDLNSDSGGVTIAGGVSGVSPTLVYYTTNPSRDANGEIVYENGYGLGNNDAAVQYFRDIETITYRMEYNVSGTVYYAEVTFDAWDGVSLSDLKIPDDNQNQFILQQKVSNMTIDSNVTNAYTGSNGVTTGVGKNGYLEIWTNNYGVESSGNLTSSGSGDVYDYDDSPVQDGNYGSFQVHNLTDSETVLAWNRHANTRTPEVGFGNSTGSHPDWTFSANYNGNAWALKISVNKATPQLVINSGSGATQVSGNVSNLNSLTINSSSSSNTISGIFSGSGSLTKSGTGTLTLSGTNTYTGDTTISGGTLIVSGQLGSGSYAGNIANSGAFNYASNSNQTLSGVISGTGSLTKSGTGTLTLSGTNTYTGSTIINAGTLAITNAAGLGNSSTGTSVADGAMLQISNGITVAEPITINGSGVSSNGAIYFLSGNNTYSGAITLGSNSTITSDAGNQTISAAINGAHTLTTNTQGNLTLSGVIGGSTPLSELSIQANSNDVTLSEDITTNGSLSIAAGLITQSAGVDINSNGGDVTYTVASGASTLSNDYPVRFAGISGIETSINAGGGNISISSTFTSGTSGGSDRAILLNYATIITSGTGTISIVGDATNASNTGNTWGMQTAGSRIQTASGNISLNMIGGAVSSNSRGYAIDYRTFHVLSSSGTITIKDTKASGLTGIYTGAYLRPNTANAIVFGADGSYVTNSSSNIVLEADKIQFDSNLVKINTTGDVTLQSPDLSFDAEINLANLSITGNSSSITIGKSTNTQNITLASSISTNGAMNVFGADITISSGVSITAGAGSDIILAASDDFINNSGASALSVSGAGRWIVYAADNDNSTFGSLNSNNTAIWGSTYSTLAPASVSSGNRYVFAETASQTITFTTTDETITYGDSLDLSDNYTLTTSGIAGLTNVYDGVSSGSSSITLATAYSVNPTISIVATGATTSTSGNTEAGSYTITLSLSGGTVKSGYTIGSPANNGTLTVNTKTLTAIATATDKTYDGTTTATVGLTLSGVESGDTVTSTNSSTFSQFDVGTSITATVNSITLAGTDSSNYTISTGQTDTANITPASLTITADAQSKTYGDTFTFDGDEFTTSTMVGSESISSVLFSVASSADSTTTANVGSYAITPSSASATSGTNLNNYSITYADGSLTVGKRTLTATLTGSTTKAYDGTTAATLTSSNYALSNLVTGESITVSETSATYDNKNAGTGKTVTANLASDDFTAASGTSLSNYTLPTGNVSGAIGEVTKLSLTVTAANDAKFVTQSDTANFAGVLYSGFLSGEDASSLISAGELTVGTVERSNNSVETAGSYNNVLVPTSYAATNYDITVANGDFTIVPAEQLYVEVAPNDTTYGSSVDYSPGLSISYLDSGSNSIIDLTGSSSLSGNSFSVNDGLGTTATFDIVADGGSYSVSNNLNVGDYNLTSDNETIVGNNFNSLLINGTLTITPKAITVTADDQSKTYGDANPTLTYSVTSGALVGSDSLTGAITTAATITSNAGDYNITQGTLTNANNTNYSITYVDGTLTINQKALTITADAQSKTYGDTFTFDGDEFTTSTMVGSESISSVLFSVASSADSDATVNAGNYPITPSSAVATSGTTLANYSITYATQDLTVNKANLTVTADDVTKTYGDANPSLTVTYSGFKNSETASALSGSPTVSTLATASSSVGDYDITPSVGSLSSSNYSFSYVNGTLTITPKAITVTADDQSKTYGDANPTLTYSVTSGALVGSDSLTGAITTAATITSNAGDYNITQGTLTNANNTNYSITYVDGTLTINQKALTITADAQSKTYGDTFTFDGDEFTTSTMVGSESISSVLFSVASSADSTTTANVGSYAITPSSASATSGTNLNNYSITYADGSLTVGKRTLTATLTGSTTKAYDGTTAATLTSSNYALSNLVTGESITVSETSATYDNKNAGTGKTVTANLASDDFTAASGTSLSNYTLPTGNVSGAIGEVTKANLTLSGTKTYDGTTSFAASDVTSVAGVNSETFTVTGAAVMSSKNVQSNTNLSSLGTFALTGNSGALTSNYNDLSVSNTSISVTQKAVTLTPSAITKTYDGGFTYNANASDLQALTSLLESGDTVSDATLQFRSSGSNNKNANADTNGTLAGALKWVDIASGSVTIADGNNGQNYSVTLSGAQVGKILKSSLSITAANDAKFVTQTDPVGFAGVLYNGFVSGESALSLVTAGELSLGTISRSNASVNSAGSYSDVLRPSGYGATNYEISYAYGDFTVIPADQLYVELSPSDVTYGTDPNYATSLSATYLDSSNNSIVDLSGNATVSGSSITVNDGLGTIANFNITPVSGSYSTSSNLNVGGYNLTSTNDAITGSNFNSLLVNGTLNVTRKSIDPTDSSQLSISSIEKTYDGTSTLSGVSVNYDSSSTSIISGDVLTISGSGSYADRHVGTGKTYTVNLGLSGTDSGNYQLSSTQVTKTNGVITQLNSVTWTNSAGDNLWSNRLNWANGALPDQSNVASVILGVNDSVIFDYDSVGQIGSTVNNAGSISVEGVNNFTFTNAFSGAGDITLDEDGTGVITLSGNSANYTGDFDINGNTVILNHANALGTGTLISSDGSMSVASGITLNQVTTSGTLNISSDINTNGAIVFGGDVVIVGGNGTVNSWDTLKTGYTIPSTYTLDHLEINANNSNILFDGSITAGQNSRDNVRSLKINAGTGAVTINERIGYAFNNVTYTNLTSTNLWQLNVTGESIILKADVMTFEEQIYNGAVFIGDNGNNGLTRTLLSIDPAITFNGTVDDLIANTHTLIIKAITLARVPPAISFMDEVNSIKSLVEYRAITGQQDVNDFFGITLSSGGTLGTITLSDGTVANGLYRFVRNVAANASQIDAGQIQQFYNQIFRSL